MKLNAIDIRGWSPIVGRTRVGTEVPVQILRDGRAITLEVRTDELPEENPLRIGASRPRRSPTPGRTPRGTTGRGGASGPDMRELPLTQPVMGRHSRALAAP